MGLDFPQILIIAGILATVAWAIYNKLHPDPTAHKHRR